MNQKVNKKQIKLSVFITLIFVFIFVSVAAISPRIAEKSNVVQTNVTLPQDIKTLLGDYSQSLSSGNTVNINSYSPQMLALVKERKNYYNEYFDNGLNAKLINITSKFNIDGSEEVNLNGNVYNIKLFETLSLSGQPKITQPEKFPLILAAKWAIKKSSNANVKNALNEYISSMTDGVNQSVKEGVQLTLTINHDMDIIIENGQARIIRDSYSDKRSDNPEGNDNITWVSGNSLRQKPDLTKKPDFVINHSSIEALGQSLLDDYTKAYGNITISPNTTGFTYSRSAATTYVTSYSSNPSTYCSGSSSILQATSHYNSSYSNVWKSTGCNDCADFVSQALARGGFPTDGKWYASIASSDWVNTYNLLSYLQGLGAVTNYSNYTSLQIGDLAFTSGNDHVVMVSHVNPYYYSGHTNDRDNTAWSSQLVNFWHVYTNQP